MVRGVLIPWSPDSESIIFSTDSVAGSDERVRVWFHGKCGNIAGGVYIGFNTQIEFTLGGCSYSIPPFPDSLPTEKRKIWTFTYNYTEVRIVIYCNRLQVLNVVLSDSVCARFSNWRDLWERKPTQIQFHSTDTASDNYSISLSLYR